MEARELSSAVYPIHFLMTDPLDHVTGVAGLAVTVQLSKNGGAFATASGAVSEIGNGVYSLAGNVIDRNTLGELMLYATAVGADPAYKKIDIVDYDPFSDNFAGILSTLRQYSAIYDHAKRGSIEIKRSTDVSIELFGAGDLTGRTNLYFTVKKMSEKDSATDAQSIIQIEETAGLLYINKNAAGIPANGSITVTDALAGTLTIELAAVESNKLDPNESYLYDLKMDNTVMVEGRFFISTAITRTLT